MPCTPGGEARGKRQMGGHDELFKNPTLYTSNKIVEFIFNFGHLCSNFNESTGRHFFNFDTALRPGGWGAGGG